MRVSGAKLACCDSLGGGATVATFLGGTEGDCVFLCCSTAAWFTYGVCGIVGTGIGVDGVCTLGCVLLQSYVGSRALSDCDPVDPVVVLSSGSKNNLSWGCNGDSFAG